MRTMSGGGDEAVATATDEQRRRSREGSETVEVLGKTLTFNTDPDRLNEAGVVWGPAVRALASAVAPMLRRRLRRLRRRGAGDDKSDDSVRRGVGVLELGAGTGALGIALAGKDEGFSFFLLSWFGFSCPARKTMRCDASGPCWRLTH